MFDNSVQADNRDVHDHHGDPRSCLQCAKIATVVRSTTRWLLDQQRAVLGGFEPLHRSKFQSGEDNCD